MRAALLPRVADDVATLDEQVTGRSFQDWLDVGHAQPRSSLRPTGRIGTGYQSIDNPLGAGRARRQRRRAS